MRSQPAATLPALILKGPPVFRRSEHRQGGTRRRQGESYLDDAQRATQSKGDSRGAGGEPGADADWTRIVRGHGLDADIRGLTTVTDMDWLRTRLGCGLGMVKGWLRTRSRRGHGLFSDWTRSRPGHGHGHHAGRWCGHSASKPRPLRGRRILVLTRSKACLREKPSGEGNKRRQMRHVKRRHIAKNPLPPFVAICHWCECGSFRWPNG